MPKRPTTQAPCTRSASRCADRASRKPTHLTRWFLLPLLWLGALYSAAAEERLSIELSDGTRLEARFVLPEGGNPPYPAVMLFGGLETGAQAINLLPGFDAHIAFASFDYPYTPPRRFRLWKNLGELPKARQAIADTIEGVGVLYQALAAHPKVDPQRITVVGASLGAPFAMIAAGQQPIPGVVSVQGFGALEDVIAHQFHLAWGEDYGVVGRWAGSVVARLITWYADLPSPEAHAEQLRASQNALVIVSRDDQRIPQAASDALWEAVQASPAGARRIDMEGGHLYTGADAMIRQLLSITLDWKQDVGLLE
ncbi:hypothetical protein KHP57_12460 [Algiphilus sp. NNCM1]|uniref:alpha/beta hydrolase n=1 Tax=Algiphilus sp. TaxID=1872431 RepID=UPI001CA66F24|nr:hypothetical protein [Algiphilus sp.]MBY8966514.1 hypothetical protein [Algiphilus acroporae]MCI5062211.1 hypothetical protein [Algiphilus sp.]MCI5104493.1 hypothetical protein [Algiphilus sp.]